MHALIVVAHPDPASLTHAVARQVAEGISAVDAGHTFEVADLAAEGFALVLVYPVYWWSFPGLLKGWIDRVFTQGWAYEDADGKLVKKLQRLNVHLVALGGANQRTYARHGYFGAMKTQIDHGIFGYCGANVATSELLLPSDAGFPAAHLDAARTIGQKIFSSRAVIHEEEVQQS
jgi:NAD(P)H dehydrogenase (quinone)